MVPTRIGSAISFSTIWALVSPSATVMPCCTERPAMMVSITPRMLSPALNTYSPAFSLPAVP